MTATAWPHPREHCSELGIGLNHSVLRRVAWGGVQNNMQGPTECKQHLPYCGSHVVSDGKPKRQCVPWPLFVACFASTQILRAEHWEVVVRKPTSGTPTQNSSKICCIRTVGCICPLREPSPRGSIQGTSVDFPREIQYKNGRCISLPEALYIALE
jgi:hypothetical protein